MHKQQTHTEQQQLHFKHWHHQLDASHTHTHTRRQQSTHADKWSRVSPMWHRLGWYSFRTRDEWALRLAFRVFFTSMQLISFQSQQRWDRNKWHSGDFPLINRNDVSYNLHAYRLICNQAMYVHTYVLYISTYIQVCANEKYFDLV